jgi:tagatose-6-phosphate ketose/aldose isomerase
VDPVLADLLAVPYDDQQTQGYGHTLREIYQQPDLWVLTAKHVIAAEPDLRAALANVRGIVLTGSGSSAYLGDCIRYAVQAGAGITTLAQASGELLLLGAVALPVERPLLLVSFARSGDSPESGGLLRYLLECAPEVTHLVVTCNRDGHLARDWGNKNSSASRVRVITLDDRTCDRSLVMTSSFTNMAVAGLGIGSCGRPEPYLASAEKLAEAGAELLSQWAGQLARVARRQFTRLIALGDGGCFGAARETALKMLEMTEGRVVTIAETSLGFRHGPMCALDDSTLLVVFLSSDPLRRAYQVDLLEEIARKELGGTKVIVGAAIPAQTLSEHDLGIELPELGVLSDNWASILFVVVGQLLGFFRCRAEGLQPDRPASNGAISRVVSGFPLHGILQ